MYHLETNHKIHGSKNNHSLSNLRRDLGYETNGFLFPWKHMRYKVLSFIIWIVNQFSYKHRPDLIFGIEGVLAL